MTNIYAIYQRGEKVPTGGYFSSSNPFKFSLQYYSKSKINSN